MPKANSVPATPRAHSKPRSATRTGFAHHSRRPTKSWRPRKVLTSFQAPNRKRLSEAGGRESSIRVQVSHDIEITDALESTTPLVVEDALVEQSDSPVAIEAFEQENTPDVQTHLPVENAPSKHEQLNSAAIGWLGSFADDLSAVDEALRELLDRRVAEQAISGVVANRPLGCRRPDYDRLCSADGLPAGAKATVATPGRSLFGPIRYAHTIRNCSGEPMAGAS